MKNKTGRPLYSIGEAYGIVYKGIRTAPYKKKAIKNNLISQQFKEKIMLAVTEVNDCPLCSYAHTKMALETGMSNEEIEAMLSGAMDGVLQEELPAVLFAQHYAEMRGKPSKESWQRLVQEYGEEKAMGILGAVRTIMIGNAYGIPLGSLRGRLKGNADKRSSLPYELGMTITVIPITLIALIHAGIAGILRVSVIKFK